MFEKSDLDVTAIMRDGRAIDRAIAAAGIKALRVHRAAGVPLVIWRDGQVAHVPAEEFDEAALLKALDEI